MVRKILNHYWFRYCLSAFEKRSLNATHNFFGQHKSPNADGPWGRRVKLLRICRDACQRIITCMQDKSFCLKVLLNGPPRIGTGDPAIALRVTQVRWVTQDYFFFRGTVACCLMANHDKNVDLSSQKQIFKLKFNPDTKLFL